MRFKKEGKIMKQNKFLSIIDEMATLKENGSMLNQFSEKFEKLVNLRKEANKMDLKKSVLNNISKDTKFEDLSDEFLDEYWRWFVTIDGNKVDKLLEKIQPYSNMSDQLLSLDLLSIYYDINQKKFVIYNKAEFGSVEDFKERFEKRAFYKALEFDSIFPFDSKGNPNSNLLFITTFRKISRRFPRMIESDEDLIFVKYAFGISDKDDFYDYLLSDIDEIFKQIKEDFFTDKDFYFDFYPAELFEEHDLVSKLEEALFKDRVYHDLAAYFENYQNNKYFCDFLKKYLNQKNEDDLKKLMSLENDLDKFI